ncbi:hypothetical protein GCM10011507_02150 [Edaphobacter acidisoli]|uniref:2-oxoisovalerate dehydrogenase subunit alpha n=1 Tax=Edaphobacter acidisoli TaxID=2040573 RepID=A0A916RFB8_9BACT|nr:thiamine pyrophosphate-dependent enzyme [Edaphobacter acidisoli]GGA54452.1 hypothetical protein GCM10011507_02150 [Edaphobacter acidisoli]
MSNSKPHENPLVPNKRLREIYTLMSEARALDDFAVQAATRAKVAFKSTRGEEACRVSTAIGLGSGDLISDSHESVVMHMITGGSVHSLLRRLDTILARKLPSQTRPQKIAPLPWTKNALTRLTMATGAAASIKATRRPNLVMAYAQSRDLSDAEWSSLLKIAAEMELPIIFVVLPGHGNRNLCALAHKLGLPGFPVDADDAVALYRVAQESIGRARGDGSAVLIECHTLRPSHGHEAQNGPIPLMQKFLLDRKVSGKTWLNGVGRAYQKHLEAERRAQRQRIQR